MKNFYGFCFLILALLGQPVFAKTVAVEAMSDFTTENPPKEMSVKLLEDVVVDENLTIKAEDIHRRYRSKKIEKKCNIYICAYEL